MLGAEIGTVLLPGIGTLIGGALGALFGGMGAKALTDDLKNDIKAEIIYENSLEALGCSKYTSDYDLKKKKNDFLL